jgi:predicted RNase H-like HicB family nuclease
MDEDVKTGAATAADAPPRARVVPISYPAIIETGPFGSYGVFFPDLMGCVSAGTTLEETESNARAVLSLSLAAVAQGGEPLPKASDLEEIEVDPDVTEVGRVLITVPD